MNQSIQFGWKHRILFAVGIPLFLFLLMEGIARLIPLSEESSQAQALQLEMPSWMVEARIKPRSFTPEEVHWMAHFESGEGFRVRLKPNSAFVFHDTFSWTRETSPSHFAVRANSLGFRSAEPEHLKNFDLTVYGDSSSFGWGVEEEEIYHSLVARKLSLSVGNFAMPGDSSEFGKLVFERFATRFPSQNVILSFGANDARQSSIPHRLLVQQYSESLTLHSIRSTLLSQSRLFSLMERIMASSAQSTAPSTPPRRGPAVRLEQYKANLSEMVHASRESGAQKIIFVGVCSPAAYLKTLRLLAKRLGVHYVNGQQALRDAIPELRSGALFPDEVRTLRGRLGKKLEAQPLLFVSSDGCHPNHLGHRIIAQRVEQVLLERSPEPLQLKQGKKKKIKNKQKVRKQLRDQAEL